MTDENPRTGASETEAQVGGEPKRGRPPKRKYHRAEPGQKRLPAFVQLECEPSRPAVSRAKPAPELPDPVWTAEFIAALAARSR